MEVFREDEEDEFSGDFIEEVSSCLQRGTAVCNPPNPFSIVRSTKCCFWKGRIFSPEDISDSRRELEYNAQ